MDPHKYTPIPPAIPTESHLLLHRKLQLFSALSQDFPVERSKELSKKERTELSLDRTSFTYGEVDFISLGETIEIIQSHHGPIPTCAFYDLGSGSGKGVISAALLYPFSKCVGIELLKSLFDISLDFKLSYEQTRLSLIESHSDIWSSLPDIEFIHSDMFETGWSDAGFIFANSTCFDQSMMDRISAAPAQPGTWAVTLTKHLMQPWAVLQSFRKSMSWGDATVYIHQRS